MRRDERYERDRCDSGCEDQEIHRAAAVLVGAAIVDAALAAAGVKAAEVALVSLSTTLTTNSVVEGKGSPVCVLLAGYDLPQIKASGLMELLGNEAIVALTGGHDAGGAAQVRLTIPGDNIEAGRITRPAFLLRAKESAAPLREARR